MKPPRDGLTLVDTHQHLWDLCQFPYTWCASIPALNRSFLLPEYVREAAGRIAKTVFMECDVDDPHSIDEARHIQTLAEAAPVPIAGMVAAARPERQGFGAHLEKLAALSRVRGVRRVLHTQPDALSQSSLFAENLRTLANFGFTFDLCLLARQLPLGQALAKACPNVTFIVDHCGVPDVKAGAAALDPWRAEIRRLAELPNTVGKISGVIAYADPARWAGSPNPIPAITEILRPWVEHVIESFGWQRVVWGGDWPVCTRGATLSHWIQVTHALTASASPTDRSALYHQNAERIYRI